MFYETSSLLALRGLKALRSIEDNIKAEEEEKKDPNNKKKGSRKLVIGKGDEVLLASVDSSILNKGDNEKSALEGFTHS